MATPSIKQTASKPALSPSPAQAQLDSLVELAINHLNDGLTALCARLSAAFLEVDEPGLDAATVYHRVRSGNLLKSQSYAWIHLASAAIGTNLRKEALALRPIAAIAAAAADAAKLSADALSLVPMEEMDLSVTFATISRPFEAACAEALATLNVRLGFLLERDTLRVGQNPFRPDLVLLALNQAWCEFAPDAEAHPLFAPLLRPAVAIDFAPLYEALNSALEATSGQAMRIRKTDNAARARAERASGKAALAKQLRQFLAGGGDADSELPLIPDLPAMPQGKGGWRPSGADGFYAEAAAPAAAPLVAGTHDARQQGGVGGTGQVMHGGQPGQAGQHGNIGYPIQTGQDGAAASAHPPGFVPAPFGQFAAGGSAHFSASAQHGHSDTGAGGMPFGQGLPAAQQGQFAVGGAGAMPAAQQGSLLDLLARLPGLPAMPAAASAGVPPAGGTGTGAPHNVFYLPRLKQAMPAGALNRGDATTLDLLSRIFDTVYLDQSIPQPTRELIQYLQAPVLKAALLDKEFFYEEAHPARRMIDLMSRMGWEQRGPGDPLFQAMQRGVEKVGSDPQANVAVFAEAVAELETSLAAEEHSSAQTMAAPIAAALKQEKVSAATKSARSAVALRVGGGEMATVVEAFLQRKWTSVLTIAYSVETEKPGAVGSATRTMDDLIWSVKPKITVEQRKQLIARLPSLLTTLNKWLDIIKWQNAERLQFFADLAECHASIVRAPIDLSPERQLEVALEAAQQDAVRRVEKEQALAAAEQAEAAQAEQDPVQAEIDGLERGMWLEFSEPDGVARTVKLAWISPLRTLFIFSTAARKEAFSLPVDKLAAAWREGRLRVVRQDGVVAQALAAALAVNDSDSAAA